MLLDNKLRSQHNPDYKVIDFVQRLVKDGRLDIVTGYFSISALAEISKRLDGEVIYRMILGHIVMEEGRNSNTIDLLSDELTIDRALTLNNNSKLAINFLQRNVVEVKTIQKAFCHAKTYIYRDNAQPLTGNFHIIGSSNLTASGLGINEATSNIELNHASTGNNNDFIELQQWFKTLWEQVSKDTIKLPDSTRVDFKDYIISLISDLNRKYTPVELYQKVLYELFKKDLDKFELDPAFNLQVGHLQSTRVWNALYEFQKKGVMSLIKMIKTHGGAILADAVGLGKTWQALAVMKYFEISEGCEVILFCPKKLEQNWNSYLHKRNSRFEEDRFNFVMRYHSDLQDDRMNKEGITIDGFFTNDKPKLFVIDESHNMRNDKSQRYNFLVEHLLRPNKNVKVLLLSATPINNSLNDVRNQVKLLVKGNERGFSETLEIPKLDILFRDANKVFKEWKDNSDKKLSTFIGMLKPEFFKLTDALVLARTRSLIAEIEPDLHFPTRNSTQEDNQFITPENIGSFKSFDDLFDAFPPKLSAYQPSNYITRKDTQLKAIEDDQLQDRFLVKMMYILLIKRLESSWHSLNITATKVLGHHYKALKKLADYREKKNALAESLTAEQLEDLFEDDESELNSSELSLGKREIRFTEIDRSGLLDEFGDDLQNDIVALENLIGNLDQFKQKVDAEKLHSSADNKLEKLIELILAKQSSGKNNENKKVVIFTCYKDTAYYLFDELKKRGFENFASVAGQGSRVWNDLHEHKKFDTILERFAPLTKLMMEKQWSGFEFNKDASLQKNFKEWKSLIGKNNAEVRWKLENPVDILIATDCLSEGQNLQDADMVINYDVHWNPVRVLQRVGRIDRIGSPNLTDGIFTTNFWPSDSIEHYIRLKQRVEDRMVQMKIAGIEVDSKFSEHLRERLDDESIEDAARNKMLKSFELKWDDIETSTETFGFDDLSLEGFRQELFDMLSSGREEWEQIPNGVFTGFKAKPDLFHSEMPIGTIALLAYPARPAGAESHEYTEHLLAYAVPNGQTQFLNQKDILTVLRRHKMADRIVPTAIDNGDEPAIKHMSNMLTNWLDQQSGRASTQSVLKTLAQGKIEFGAAQNSANKEEEQRLDEKFRKENYDLITWFVVS
jgi:SNF2 family DNA or RNA helicase